MANVSSCHGTITRVLQAKLCSRQEVNELDLDNHTKLPSMQYQHSTYCQEPMKALWHSLASCWRSAAMICGWLTIVRHAFASYFVCVVDVYKWWFLTRINEITVYYFHGFSIMSWTLVSYSEYFRVDGLAHIQEACRFYSLIDWSVSWLSNFPSYALFSILIMPL